MTKFQNPKLRFPGAEFVIPRMRPGQYALAHISKTEAIVHAIRRARAKQLFICRDIRDVIVSYVQYVTYHPDKSPPRGVYDYFNSILTTDEERIMATIGGVPGVMGNYVEEFLAGKLEWLEGEAAMTVRFEDLIGNRGGGEDATQRKVIAEILEYLEVPLDASVREQIAAKLFGHDTRTFHRGQIGSWKGILTELHLAEMKRLAGRFWDKLCVDR